MVQDMRKLREQIKSKMASTLSQLRNMQQLEDKLEQAKVCMLLVPGYIFQLHA